MSVTPSGRGSLSGYEAVHVSREFRTLRRHFGSFAVPAIALFLGWLGSVTDRQPADPTRFARIQVRALTGIGAERGSRP